MDLGQRPVLVTASAAYCETPLAIALPGGAGLRLASRVKISGLSPRGPLRQNPLCETLFRAMDPRENFAFHWGSRAMFNVSRSTGLYALLFCSGLLLTSQAYAFDLNGAWATGADQCKQVFVKKGDKISFARFSKSSAAVLSQMEMTSEAKLFDAPSGRGKRRVTLSIFRPHVPRKSWRRALICV